MQDGGSDVDGDQCTETDTSAQSAIPPSLVLLEAKLLEVFEEVEAMKADSDEVRQKRPDAILTIIGHLHRCAGDFRKAKGFVFNQFLDVHNDREFRNHLLKCYRENFVSLMADVREAPTDDVPTATTKATVNRASSLTKFTSH